jgi:hypothetical protein
VEAVSQGLVNSFLSPYKPDCRYLKRAEFQFIDGETPSTQADSWLIRGDFSIPESCYIDDTGHFNSVEFNICYNQLFYIMVAHLVQHRMLEALQDWDLAMFKRRQLSDFLIVKFSSTFKQPINSRAFQGTLLIDRCSVRSNLTLLKTSCAFYGQTGWSEGEVTIAVVDQQQDSISEPSQQTFS